MIDIIRGAVWISFTFLALIIVMSTRVYSQEPVVETGASAERGQRLAERLCVQCHVVASDSNATVPDGVPTFKVIANKPNQSADHIKRILLQPHAPMPNMSLSVQEMDDIIAYLDEFRPDGDNKPLLPEKSRKKVTPDYPEPS